MAISLNIYSLKIALMKKRGQITIFLIMGIIILILAGSFYYIKSYSAKSTLENAPDKAQTSEANIVKTYAEACIKRIADEALFGRIGLQGGYIDPNGDAKYNENGVPLSGPRPARYLQDVVPYYLNDSKTYYPSLGEIGNKISNYVNVEFGNCFKKDAFEAIGIVIEPLEAAKAEVSINQEDVSVNVDYTTNVRKGGTKTSIKSFRVVLPIRLKPIYESAIFLVEKVKSLQPDNEYDTSADCSIYDKNGLTNVYLRNTNDNLGKIVQFVDFSTYNNYYFNSFIFQFGVMNVTIKGSCVG